MPTTYTYSVSADTANGAVSPRKLTSEVKADQSITIVLDGISVTGDVLDATFLADLSAGEKTTLDAIVAAHDGIPPAAKPGQLNTDLSGHLMTVSQIPTAVEGAGVRFVTHNFCDACSWWQESTEDVDGATSANGAFTEYTLAGTKKVIDLRHARLTFEDEIDATTVAPNGNTMSHLIPTVKVDGVALDQSNEDAQAGNDRYTIDYETMKVVFAVARGAAEVVTVSCRRADKSLFTFQPPSGKAWVFEDAEIDVTEDADMLANFKSAIHGSHSVQTGGAVVELGSRIYKSFHDFHAAARRFYGPVPSGFGGQGGVPTPKWTFEWQYNRSDVFYASPNYVDQNLDETKVTFNRACTEVIGDSELGGSILTVTYYGQEVDE